MAKLLDITPAQVAKFTVERVNFKHKIADHDRFSLTAIEALIAHYPPELIEVYQHKTGHSHAAADIELTGQLTGLANQPVAICLKELEHHAPLYYDLIDLAIEEIHDENLELKTFQRRCSLWIGSHLSAPVCAAPPHNIAWWQIHGDAMVQFPSPDDDYRQLDEDTPQKGWQNLVAGQALALPGGTPCQLQFSGPLSVAVLSEYCTPETDRKSSVTLANELLKAQLGLHMRSTQTRGPAALAKRAVSWAALKTGYTPPHSHNH